MSRDGSEGWAVGPGDNVDDFNAKTTLYHFDGSKWTRCGIEPHGPVPADPACAGLAGRLRRRRPPLLDRPRAAGARLRPDQRQRVPGRRGRRRTGRQQPLIARYKDGRWSIDEAGASDVSDAGDRLVDVAFTAPNDGWAIGRAMGLAM